MAAATCRRTQAAAARDNVVWLTINSGAPGKQGHMSGAEAKAFVARSGARPAAYLLDPRGDVGRAYDARTTPHMYVVNGARQPGLRRRHRRQADRQPGGHQWRPQPCAGGALGSQGRAGPCPWRRAAPMAARSNISSPRSERRAGQAEGHDPAGTTYGTYPRYGGEAQQDGPSMKEWTCYGPSALPPFCSPLRRPPWRNARDENAVEAADDAFGTSVGNEKIGLYNADNVRGFSPITAGNIRIEGLSVTEHGGFTQRVVSGSTIRVGLTAQGYPFPAPTGIADYSLRSSGNEAVVQPGALSWPEQGRGAGGRRSASHRSRSAERRGRFQLPLRGEFPWTGWPPRGGWPSAARWRRSAVAARATGSKSSPFTGAWNSTTTGRSARSSLPGLICPRRSSAAFLVSTGP